MSLRLFCDLCNQEIKDRIISFRVLKENNPECIVKVYDMELYVKPVIEIAIIGQEKTSIDVCLNCIKDNLNQRG